MKGNLGGGYGSSNIKDPYSGKPLLTYENQNAKSSQLLSDRVAPTFDPTIPQKIDPSVLHNGRMPESASEAVRKATGAKPDEQLDHLISLELGGSNDTSNLNNEKLNSQGVQPSLTLENATAKAVANGDISYIQGQKIIARAKGVQLPDDPDFSSSPHPLASDYPNPAPNQTGTESQTKQSSLLSKIEGVASAAGKAIESIPSKLNSSPIGSAFEKSGPVEMAADIQAKGLGAGLKQFAEQVASRATAPSAEDIASGKYVQTPWGPVSLSKTQAAALGTGGETGDVSGIDPASVTNIAKETDPAKISSILSAKGVDGDAANAISPFLAKANTPEQVTAILQTAAEHGLLFNPDKGGLADQFNEQNSTEETPGQPKALSSAKPVSELYDQFDQSRAKVPGLESSDMKDVANAYPLTDEAKKTVLDNTTQTNKHIPGEYASFGESKTGKDVINVSQPEPTNTFHELIHSWFANTKTPPDLNAFQSAFDGEKANNPVLQNIDQTLSKDTKNYPASSAKDLPEERFAYVAEAYGAKGLNAIPESLRPFYQDVLKPTGSTLEASGREATQTAIEKETAEQAQIHAQNEETSKPVENDSMIQKLKNSLNPLKAQDADVKKAYEDYTKKLAVGKQLANEEAKPLSNIPAKEGIDTILRYERGSSTPYTEAIHNQFESLYDEARSRGFDVPHRANYLPHTYGEAPEEIQKVVRGYLAKKGVPQEQIDEFMKGGELPQSTARRLGINPSFAKTRMFPTYQEAIDAGLHPKFTHPAQLAGHYRAAMERASANRELVQDLVKKGKIVTAADAPKGWQPVNLEFSQEGYYARPRLAQMLNGLFNDNQSKTFWQQLTGVTGKISRGLQKIELTTGIPGTNINFHSVGQIIKEITAGNFNKIVPFIRSASDKASVTYFEANRDILIRAARQGLDIGRTVADYPNLYDNLMKPTLKEAYGSGGMKSAAGFLAKNAGTAFNNIFTRKNFTSFMPQLYVSTFKDASDRFVAQGMAQNDADSLAADVVKAFHGLIGNIGRAQATEDGLSTAFFAPQFRESIINTLWNSGKSVTTEIGNPAFYLNRRLLGGMLLTYGLYAAANKYFNGHYIWQNPSTHQFDLQIPTSKGNYAYIPFMPSFLAVPRNLFGGALSLGQADLQGATQQFSSVLSAPLQLFGELYANKDFYGNPIYNNTDPAKVKAQKIAGFLGLNTVPPFIGAAVNYIEKKGTMPLYQAVSTGMELPIKYGTAAQNNTSDFYTALNNYDNAHAQAIATFRPTFDKIQTLIQSGQNDQAQQMVNNLSDSDYTLYKDLKTAASSAATTKAESQFMPTYQQIQSLITSGKQSQAQQMVNGLSASDYKLYQKLKAKDL